MNYGLPYKGSKNLIADKLLGYMPGGDVFVDLFCGGCAMTHAAMVQHKYKRYIVNDINPICPTLFYDAIMGKYSGERRWVSREEFNSSTDPYVKFCWSFGNNLTDYMYHNEIEPYKRACHYAVVFDQWSELQRLCPEVWETAKQALDGVTSIKERRLKFGPSIIKWLKSNGSAGMVASNLLYRSAHWRGGFPGNKRSDLQSLESLQSLERLNKNYWEVDIPDGAIVYCDIPYKGTDGYTDAEFDHSRFYGWFRSLPHPAFLSEYAAPFTCVAEINHRSRLSAKNNTGVTEKLFFNGTMADYNKLMNTSNARLLSMWG